MTTLTQVKASLYDLFVDGNGNPGPDLTKTKTVYLGEPRPGDMLGPIAVTVGTGRGTPTELEFLVRVYGKPDADALQVQADMDVTIQEVWTILEPHTAFVVPGFEATYIPEIDSLVATFKVTTARGDLS